MEIYFNTNQNNPFFSGRLPYSKEFLNATLKPYTESNTPAPMKFIVADTKFCRNTIAKWIKDTYKMSVGQFYRIERNKQREKDVITLVAQGKSVKQIADTLCLCQVTIYNLFKTLKLKTNFKNIPDTLRDKIIELVYAGYSIKRISKEIGFGTYKTDGLVRIVFNDSIKNVRKNNGIAQKRCISRKKLQNKKTENKYNNKL